MARGERIKRRPAEAGAFSVAVVVSAALGLFNVNLSDTQLQAVLVLVGAVPGLITWLSVRRNASSG